MCAVPCCHERARNHLSKAISSGLWSLARYLWPRGSWSRLPQWHCWSHRRWGGSWGWRQPLRSPSCGSGGSVVYRKVKIRQILVWHTRLFTLPGKMAVKRRYHAQAYLITEFGPHVGCHAAFQHPPSVCVSSYLTEQTTTWSLIGLQPSRTMLSTIRSANARIKSFLGHLLQPHKRS